MAETAEKLSITLTPQLADRVRKEVEAGSYGSVSEAIREALRDWQAKLDRREAELDHIRERIRQSIDDPRPRVPVKEAYERIRAHADKVKAEHNDEAA